MTWPDTLLSALMRPPPTPPSPYHLSAWLFIQLQYGPLEDRYSISSCGKIEHDCASGSPASPLQGSPDPLVRELIAIDTLLKEVSSRITLHLRGVTVRKESFFPPSLCCCGFFFPASLFIPQVAPGISRSADSGDVEQQTHCWSLSVWVNLEWEEDRFLTYTIWDFTAPVFQNKPHVSLWLNNTKAGTFYWP